MFYVLLFFGLGSVGLNVIFCFVCGFTIRILFEFDGVATVGGGVSVMLDFLFLGLMIVDIGGFLFVGVLIMVVLLMLLM